MSNGFCFITDTHLFNHAVGTRTYNLAKKVKKIDDENNKVIVIGKNDRLVMEKYDKNGMHIYLLPGVDVKYLHTILFMLIST